MKTRLIALITLVCILGACNGDKKTGKTNKVAQGDVFYGGVFRINEVEDFRNLFPLNVTEVTSHRITNQIYEGLVKLSQKDLSILPSLAERWEINEDATSFTFYLRKGVKYHDDPAFENGIGREVTAKDFKYCFNLLCTDFGENQGFWVFKDRVIGATEYYNSTTAKAPLKDGVEGVKVIDDYTLQIDLKYPFSGFLNILSTPFTWAFPQEVFEKYGVEMRSHAVGTGAFMVKNIKEGQAIVLERNPDYWDIDEFGNQLPYLDALKFTFLKEKKSELLEFKKGNLEMVYRLPLEMIKDVTSELENAKEGNISFELQNIAAQSTFYYGFQNQGKIFDNKNLRLAFNYAIDRESIVNYTLQGEGVPGNYGIVPPAYKSYESSKLVGYTFDPEKARKYMAAAGYPNGKGFPKITLQINSGGGDRNVQTAEVIQKMLNANLNIEVKIDVMPFAQHLDALETGKADFWRTAWIADYPDPENFLNLLYGGHIPNTMAEKSYINSVRYVSPVFDSLFKAGLREVDLKKRNELYLMAEQVAIDDAAIMPIFYDENTRLIQVYVKNFPINSMELRDFSKVYIDPNLMEKK
ncbi:MAG: ABC transporter substrate-binding protein [Bacteroidetes bacterium]|nr:ABC transporter substrate-binding protein [Bacteroidota bacterium]HET6243256.1 ABC transporter substrate-binding protein [Bacteroidia bacterium]